MSAPTFGLQFIRRDDAPLPVIGSNLDVVGIVGPCSSADPTIFPLNEPVLVYSNDSATLSLLGQDGYIPGAINAINEQLADFQVAAQLVIVVTPYGTDADANLKLQQTIANIMGNSIARTGVWALQEAPNLLYCTPRLITVPGYTGQMANSLNTLTLTTSGIGYIPNVTYDFTFVAGNGETNGANLVLPSAHATADANGMINEANITIDTFGAWMTVAPIASLPLPDGPPVTALSASGQIIFNRTPGIGSTVTLNGSTVTFAAPGSSGAVTSGSNLTGGASGVAATGWIGFTNNPANNDWINIGGTRVTFVTGAPTGNQVQIQANLAGTLAQLETFLTNSADVNIALSTYSLTGDTINITAKTTGTGGNAITLATSVTLGGNQVLIADDYDLNTTMTHLLAFLNGSTDAMISENTYTLVQGATLNIVQKTGGSAGNGYTIASTVTGASLSGTTLKGGRDAEASRRAVATAALSLGANPVCATLSGGLLDGLMGHAVVESSGVSQIDDENWRDTMASARIIAVSGGVKILDSNGDIVVEPFAPYVVGLIIAKDFATGYPFHSAANQPVNGIVGPGRDIGFSLTDGATEGQQLLAANIGIIARGEVGVETAISNGGFIFVGTDTLSTNPLWEFYNVTRGRDYIELSLMPTLRTYLGSTNIDAQTVQNILTTIETFLSGLTSLGQILGFTAGFSGSMNTVADIREGQLTVAFRAEEPPVLRRLVTYSERYAPAIDTLISQLQSQLSGGLTTTGP